MWMFTLPFYSLDGIHLPVLSVVIISVISYYSSAMEEAIEGEKSWEILHTHRAQCHMSPLNFWNWNLIESYTEIN